MRRPIANETEPGVCWITDPMEWLRVCLPGGFLDGEVETAAQLLDDLIGEYARRFGELTEYAIRGSVRYRLLWDREERQRRADPKTKHATRPHARIQSARQSAGLTHDTEELLR